VSGLVAAHSDLLQEVPDLVEYPSVVAGHFPVEFLQLPEEVLTTTMIHHQHYFPVVDDAGHLKPAFLAVTNMQVEKPEIIARNSERVLTARLRDARFFWDEDRKTSLASRVDQLATVLFHKKLGTYREKAERIAALARWIAADVLGAPEAADHAEQAARLAKADLATDMVRELTELQGTMGGIYAREEGQPEAVWKAIALHYLPIGVDAEAAPSRQALGTAAATWAAVALADKLDSVVGMFAVGERPTGSRDPLGLRRQAQGIVKILVDLPHVAGIERAITLGTLLQKAGTPWTADAESTEALHAFMRERVVYLFEQRGFDVRTVRAVTQGDLARLDLCDARRKLDALSEMSGSEALQGVATLFKRAKNITKGAAAESLAAGTPLRAALTEPSELALVDALDAKASAIHGASARGAYREAFSAIAALQPAVATFFDDVLVMADDPTLRRARLALVATLRDLILDIADLSEIVTES
jgi:glycyl-tRNA synthetase beta chain